MKLNYYINPVTQNYSTRATPSLSAQRLPFCVYSGGHMSADDSYYTERDGLDNYLLIYTIAGKGYLKYNGAEYSLEPNQCVIFYCFEPQYYCTALGSGGWEFKWVHVGGAALKEYYQRINGDDLNVVVMGRDTDISRKFDAIFEYTDSGEMLSDIKTCGVVADIFTEVILCRNSELNNRNYQRHKTEIEKVVQYIQQNYNKKIGVDDITRQVLISKYHFLRLFKAYSGVSPYEYLINYRITSAKRLLKETELGISEICGSVGFSDTNNFIRYFKRITGTTPGNYRRYWIN